MESETGTDYCVAGARQRVHNHAAGFFTPIIQNLVRAASSDRIAARRSSPFANWIMVMENEHLISILHGCRYHMSPTVWKRKSTLPLIWKQRVQTASRFFLNSGFGRKQERRFARTTNVDILFLNGSFFLVLHHIWISVICAPLTLSTPVWRGLILSCNVTPWKAAGCAS